ncbi:MAG TPA: hypothetical protein QF572_03270 [Vicinamibacterales bacterium]|jgi:hypothetical protein|nr:hypothetical protein [Vicinamibacterales bacterium]|tara:strand:- start:119 stop:1036 length:918 start_codon:yes stop_codon:yes gene_type:complete
MSLRRQVLLLASVAAWLTACSSAPTTRQLAQDAAEAMGGVERLQAIATLTMSGGTGTRTRLGQTLRVGDEENVALLSEVVEIIDLAGGRASMRYALNDAGFTQNRHEILTRRGDALVGIEVIPQRPTIATSPSGLFSWGTQNHPEFLLRRNVISVVLAAVESGSEEPAEDREMDGETYKFGTMQMDGEEVGLYFNPESRMPFITEETDVYFNPDSQMLSAYETTDTESMLGDQQAVYILNDYRTAGDVMLPHAITIRKGGRHYSSVQFNTIAVNDAGVQAELEIPEDVSRRWTRQLPQVSSLRFH